MVLTQRLKPTDYYNCHAFCERMFDVIHNAEVNLSHVLRLNYFHLDCNVNKQNCRYYTDSKSHIIHEQPLHSLKLQIWYVVAKWGVIGSYIFTGNVNTEAYIESSKHFLYPY